MSDTPRDRLARLAQMRSVPAAVLDEIESLLEVLVDPRFQTEVPSPGVAWQPPEPRYRPGDDDRQLHDTVLRRDVVARPVGDDLALVRALVAIDHPGIVPIHELIDPGDGLRALLPEWPTTPLAARWHDASAHEIVELVLQATGAVAAAHEADLTHGALDAEHLAVGPAGGVLVTGWTGQGTAPDDVAALGRILAQVKGDDALEGIARACAEPEARATDLSQQLRAWLRGTRRQAAADAAFERATRIGAEAEPLRTSARALRAAAAARMAELAPSAAEGLKAEAWALEDEADALQARARDRDAAREQALRDATREEPFHLPARLALLEVARAALDRSEARGDDVGVLRAEAAMRAHLDAIPAEHPARAAQAAWVQGDGALSLITDPPGADVDLYRYVPRGGRLEPVREGHLGTTPLDRVPLPMGSYLTVLRHPNRPDVLYPVRIRRGEHWDGVPPDGEAPVPIVLPETLGPDEVYVPAGWFDSGDDPAAYNPLPGRRVWVDGFVISRFHVTITAWEAFLAHEVRRGGEAAYEALVPRVADGLTRGTPAWTLRDGRLNRVRGVDRRPWRTGCPVVGIDHPAAWAYAAWIRERTGQPWRLPGELEWEKAARGVDGRPYPWGSGFDPSWARVRAAGIDPSAALVTEYPLDVSPYGVRHMAGNVLEMLFEPFRADAPPNARPYAACPDDVDPTGVERWVVRGGDFTRDPTTARVANRSARLTHARDLKTSFRLARSIRSP